MKALEIKITNPQNPLKCHNVLTDIKKGRKEFTPDVARSFLQSTNNRKNIADFMDILENHLLKHPETVNDYKYILFGITANRSQPENIIEKAEALRRIYNISGIELEITDNIFEDKNEDYSNVNKLRFPKDLANMKMERCDLSKTEFDLSQSKFITLMVFDNCKMPPKVELNPTYIWALYWFNMDMNSFDITYPKEVHWLQFSDKMKFPSVLDLSGLDKVDTITFQNCDMSNIQEIQFPKTLKKLHLNKVNLPTCLDIEKLKQTYSIMLNECTFPIKKEKEEAKEEILSVEEKKDSLKNRLNKWLKGKLGNAR